jgi:hypothetical protein
MAKFETLNRVAQKGAKGAEAALKGDTAGAAAAGAGAGVGAGARAGAGAGLKKGLNL